jgi:hypothetical protein
MQLAGGDYAMLSYWLSVGATALCDLQQHPALGLTGELREDGVQEGNVDLEHSDELSAEDAEDALNATVSVAFNRLIRGASNELDRVVRYSFIEGSSAILEVGGQSQLADPSKSIFRVTDILERVLSSLLEADLPDVLVSQCFRKLLYHISASLFNAIITDASLCSAKTGFRVKMGISFLESWVTEQNKQYENVLGTAGYVSSFRPLCFLPLVLSLSSSRTHTLSLSPSRTLSLSCSSPLSFLCLSRPLYSRPLSLLPLSISVS